MRILVIADEPDKKYWDYYTEGMLKEFDLIISCGDLPTHYLDFLVTMSNCPLVYVYGNHDDAYDTNPPDGCICADGDIVTIKGLRIMGLGGCNRYNTSKYQYTEKEMLARYKKLRFKLWRSKGIDILLTHAPARHLNDEEDIPHRGFETFNEIIEKYRPRYFLHGHVHLNYNYKLPRVCQSGDTTVVNGFKSYILDIEDKA